MAAAGVVPGRAIVRGVRIAKGIPLVGVIVRVALHGDECEGKAPVRRVDGAAPRCWLRPKGWAEGEM